MQAGRYFLVMLCLFITLIKCLKSHKSLGSLLIVFSIGGGQVGKYVGRQAGRLCFYGQVMSPHHSGQMSKWSQVPRLAPLGYFPIIYYAQQDLWKKKKIGDTLPLRILREAILWNISGILPSISFQKSSFGIRRKVILFEHLNVGRMLEQFPFCWNSSLFRKAKGLLIF